MRKKLLIKNDWKEIQIMILIQSISPKVYITQSSNNKYSFRKKILIILVNICIIYIKKYI